MTAGKPQIRQHSSGTTPPSQLQSPSTPITPPDPVASPGTTSAVTDLKYVPLVTVPSQPDQIRNPTAPYGITSSPNRSSTDTQSSSSDSDEQLPTRARIRAWAKATPAGPPRNTPSPSRSAIFARSSSDESLPRRNISRSSLIPSASSLFRGSGIPLASVSSGSGSGSESGRPRPGATSGDEDNMGPGFASGLLPSLEEENSGNVADVESAGSDCMFPPERLSDPSPSTSPPAPIAPVQDQQTWLDRRGHRHRPQPVHASRRRDRDRDRDRERDRRTRVLNPTPPNPAPPSTLPPSPQAHVQRPAFHTRIYGSGTGPTLRPLRLIPELRLPLPPPGERLQVTPTTGGADVLEEIAGMLHSSRSPPVRVEQCDSVRRSREDDVLEEICSMIQRQGLSLVSRGGPR
ncbi:hypothetical protein C8Q76DRAFT_801855 [Earliella scabrosa]|nr:hypothetical protein C8Q76DRAFT_801855 [Earliella scabrosa]